jgi:hypothetical protein
MPSSTFKTQIKTNLTNNGFPDKKVAFNLEKLYELAEQKGESLNKILDEFAEENILHEKTQDKIVFYRAEQSSDMEAKLKQAKAMMEQMDPKELEQMRNMFMQMSDEEKNKIMEEAKRQGLI